MKKVYIFALVASLASAGAIIAQQDFQGKNCKKSCNKSRCGSSRGKKCGSNDSCGC